MRRVHEFQAIDIGAGRQRIGDSGDINRPAERRAIPAVDIRIVGGASHTRRIGVADRREVDVASIDGEGIDIEIGGSQPASGTIEEHRPDARVIKDDVFILNRSNTRQSRVACERKIEMRIVYTLHSVNVGAGRQRVGDSGDIHRPAKRSTVPEVDIRIVGRTSTPGGLVLPTVEK